MCLPCRRSVRIAAGRWRTAWSGGTTLICPLHSWKFDLATGEALFGDCGIKTFPVRVDEAGRIILTIDKRDDRSLLIAASRFEAPILSPDATVVIAL